jgi:hypothetical protein
MKYIWQQSALCQHRTTATGLCFTFIRKSNIYPTSEKVLGIPFRFAVAQKY